MNYKKTKAPLNAETLDLKKLSETGNIYEAVMIVSKRSTQIALEMKQELDQKLEEFANYNDNLEEIFENKEQIEISKYYERLPKPTAIALQEFFENQIYYRNPARPEKTDF